MGDITARYLEAARAKVGEKTGKKVSDYQLGKILGISTSAMHYYLKDERECDDDDIIFAIAHFAQVDPMQIIGAIRGKKAKTKEVKNFWEKAKKGAVAGFSGMALTGALLTNPAQSEASEFNILDNHSIYYTNINTSFQHHIKPIQSRQNRLSAHTTQNSLSTA